jgi:hypothetical protein
MFDVVEGVPYASKTQYQLSCLVVMMMLTILSRGHGVADVEPDAQSPSLMTGDVVSIQGIDVTGDPPQFIGAQEVSNNLVNGTAYPTSAFNHTAGPGPSPLVNNGGLPQIQVGNTSSSQTLDIAAYYQHHANSTTAHTGHSASTNVPDAPGSRIQFAGYHSQTWLTPFLINAQQQSMSAPGVSMTHCPYHDPILQGYGCPAGEALGPMERYLTGDPCEQYAILNRPDNGELSTKKACRCLEMIQLDVDEGAAFEA